MAPTLTQQLVKLPKVRLKPYEALFTYAGVDYFGPFYIKRGRWTVA